MRVSLSNTEASREKVYGARDIERKLYFALLVSPALRFAKYSAVS